MSRGLDLRAILNRCCFGWRMLWPFRCRVLVFVEGSFCEAWNVGIQGAILVVPFELDPNKELAFPVDGHIVVLFQCRYVMVGMAVASELDAEVIYYQGKGDWAPNMSP